MMDWEGIQIGSSSPTGPGSSSEPGSSIGYTEAPSAPILEESTIRLASRFIPNLV
jgi:hypothetical protein